MITIEQVEKAQQYLIDSAAEIGRAVENAIRSERMLKHIKALEMKKRNEQALGAQEREAYADPKYVQHLLALQAAVEQRERTRWLMVAAQARIEAEKANIYAGNRTDRAMR